MFLRNITGFCLFIWSENRSRHFTACWIFMRRLSDAKSLSFPWSHLRFNGSFEALSWRIWRTLCDRNVCQLFDLQESSGRSQSSSEVPSGSWREFATRSTFCYQRTFPYYSTPLKCCFSHLSDFASQGRGRAEINARLYVASHLGIRTRQPKEVAPQATQAPLQSSSTNVQALFAIFVYICSRCRRLVPQRLQMNSRTRRF